MCIAVVVGDGARSRRSDHNTVIVGVLVDQSSSGIEVEAVSRVVVL